MQEQLNLLIETLESVDNDPKKSLRFFTTAMPTTNITNVPPPDCRYQLIVDILYSMCFNIHQGDDGLARQNVDDIMLKLSEEYQSNQHHCWQAHSHHFHTTLSEYINCPVTCLYEIIEYLHKVRKDMYAIRA